MPAAKRAPKRTPRTPKRRARDWAPAFLKALAELGTVSAACEQVKIGRRTAYDRRDSDSKFAGAWDDVVETLTEMMEAEASRRAVEGWTEREIFDDEGNPIGEVRKFSDTLLIFLLKARRPDMYREQHRVEVTGVQGAPPLEIRVADREASDAARDFLARVSGP